MSTYRQGYNANGGTYVMEAWASTGTGSDSVNQATITYNGVIAEKWALENTYMNVKTVDQTFDTWAAGSRSMTVKIPVVQDLVVADSYDLHTPVEIATTTHEIQVTWRQMSGLIYEDAYMGEYVQQEESVEARESRLENKRQNKEKAELYLAKKNAAKDKANALLLSILNPTEREEWLANKTVTIFVMDKKLRLKEGRSHNIEELDENGNRIATYCAHLADYNIPDIDNVAAQLLWLQTKPESFFEMANKIERSVPA